jgi:hypothetical protein
VRCLDKGSRKPLEEPVSSMAPLGSSWMIRRRRPRPGSSINVEALTAAHPTSRSSWKLTGLTRVGSAVGDRRRWCLGGCSGRA